MQACGANHEAAWIGEVLFQFVKKLAMRFARQFLAENRKMNYACLMNNPSFSLRILRRCRASDAMRRREKLSIVLSA
jgi:hypothetical protein